MGWGKIRENIKDNALAYGLAPFTAGTSLIFAKNNDGEPIIGDITGANSAKKANEQNITLQNATNQQSINLANTAHQREIADLKAAGLNPVLSAGGSGSATPTLGTAQVQNTLPGGYLAQAQSAGQVASLFSQAKNLNAQSKAIPSQVELNKTQAGLNEAQEQVLKDQHEFYDDTGYWPGATETSNGGFNAFGIGGNRSQTTPIRNTKKNSGRSNWAETNKDMNKAKDNYNRTKKKEQERIKKLEEMGWHNELTTHR